MKYVIYCRKSSDENSDNQKESIPQQLKLCVQFAKDNGLEIMEKPADFSEFETDIELLKEDMIEDANIKRLYQETRNLFIVKEEHSAKVPFERKKRRSLIKLIEKQKIRGLISYSPDRQARNILEGGELINFIDNKQFELDLKYTNFNFEPTASGKMMLGVWFVFSKQYSDKLSEDVNRGNKNIVESGQSLGEAKYGYFRNDKKYMEPDPQTFEIAKEMFALKIYQKKSNAYIVKRLETRGFQEKSTDRRIRPSAKNMNKIWNDMFYHGRYTVAGYSPTNQSEINPYYMPLITSDEYEQLQKIVGSRNNPPQKGVKRDIEDISIVPNGMFITNDGFVVNATLPGKNQRFLPKLHDLQKAKPSASLQDVVKLGQIRYSVNNPKSTLYKLEITGDILDDAISKKLSEFLISENEYQTYCQYVSKNLENMTKEKTEKISQINIRINERRSKLNQFIKNTLGIKRDETEEKVYQITKLNFQQEIQLLENELSDIKSNERNQLVEFELFTEVLNNVSTLYRQGTNVQKAKICKILFLNIILDKEKGLTFKVNPLFEKLFVLYGDRTGSGTPLAGLKVPSPNR